MNFKITILPVYVIPFSSVNNSSVALQDRIKKMINPMDMMVEKFGNMVLILIFRNKIVNTQYLEYNSMVILKSKLKQIIHF